jgi:GTP cyclohydrolase FolE2
MIGYQSTIQPSNDCIGDKLPRENESWLDFARRTRNRRVGVKRVSVHDVTVLVNLCYFTDFSEDKVREYLMDAVQSERRHRQVLRAKARYRAKNRESINAKRREYYKLTGK